MEFEQNPQQVIESEEAETNHNYDTIASVLNDSKSSNGCFDCNICFDCAQEPVVTLCGHLFCWPCIFKWLRVRSCEPVQNCPICKANISEASLVPLYGHGSSHTEPDLGSTNLDLSIPPRPPATGLSISSHSNQHFYSHPLGSESSLFQHNHFHHPHDGSTEFSSSSNLGGTVMSGIINPTLEMLGELVQTRILGSLHTGLFTYPNSYSSIVGGGSTRRMTRQEIQLTDQRKHNYLVNKSATFFPNDRSVLVILMSMAMFLV